jgi:multiple sugar transport system ATP-binding protein
VTVSEPFLAIEDISKAFGTIRALRGVNLEVGEDELLVVLGPTGAGKTTLLRTIVGLEEPDGGRIRLAGDDVTHLPPPARDMALVFQNFSLYPEKTVRRNMEFPLKAPGRKETSVEITKRVEWAAGLLKISHLLDRPSVNLSGGEMQRVAIGRAIVRRPRLFLMDEPLTNLDAKLREVLRVELALLRRELGTPMIFVTHDQAEALSMADRIVVLSEGKVLQTGTPEEIYRQPASPTVALQVGQPRIKIFNVRRSAGTWVTDFGARIADGRGVGGDTATAGVRPEDIDTSGGERPATVKVVENMGPVKIVLASWAGQDVHILVSRDTAVRVRDELFPRVDTSRTVVWPAD